MMQRKLWRGCCRRAVCALTRLNMTNLFRKFDVDDDRNGMFHAMISLETLLERFFYQTKWRLFYCFNSWKNVILKIVLQPKSLVVVAKVANSRMSRMNWMSWMNWMNSVNWVSEMKWMSGVNWMNRMNWMNQMNWMSWMSRMNRMNRMSRMIQDVLDESDESLIETLSWSITCQWKFPLKEEITKVKYYPTTPPAPPLPHTAIPRIRVVPNEPIMSRLVPLGPSHYR